MPSDEALKAAQELFVMSGLVIARNSKMANYLDRMMAEVRLKEAKWWHEMNDENNDELRRSRCERVAELERLASPDRQAGRGK